MKQILVLGGTGAMGRPLVKILSESCQVFVTSRSAHPSSNSIIYLKGNAHDHSFLLQILEERSYDAIVDFMVWGNDFGEVLPTLLENTKQYVFISSARVYAQSDEPITENTPRLLDVSIDKEYLKTNEYALVKAREENLLKNSKSHNYTIVRPSVTYNTYRLQLGVLEKESWLYRALHGRSIVFSEDIAHKLTTMTLGDDVAKGIASIVGMERAVGQTYHITSPKSLPWSDVLNIYMNVLEKHLDIRPKVVMTEKTTNLQFKERVYQVIYCRYFNRTFDNSMVNEFCDTSRFVSPEDGLSKCLVDFLESPQFLPIDWRLEAYNDRVAKERTPLREIKGIKERMVYLFYRYKLSLLIWLYEEYLKIKNK